MTAGTAIAVVLAHPWKLDSANKIIRKLKLG